MAVLENIAKTYYENREYDKALTAYLDLISQYPKREDYHICCGNCFDIIGDKKSAAIHYLQARKLNKKSLPALTNLATICYETNDFKLSEKYCYQALLIDSKNISALINLGNIFYQYKEYQKALQYYQQASVLKPDYYIAEINLANTYFDLKDYQQAIKYARHAIKLDSTSTTAWILLGNSAFEIEDFITATEALHQALSLDSSDAWIENSLSQIYQKQSRWKEALEHGWQAVVKSNGDDSQHINFGYLLYESSLEKQDSLSKKYADMWLQIYPHHPIVLHIANAFKEGASPKIANPRYVQDIFDVFAPDFEQVLTGLEYRAPDLIAGLLVEIYGQKPAAKMRILDAGCGTGLCGKFLKKYASWRGLEGVDLSAGMLKEAENKKLYNRLIQSEMIGYLQEVKSRYDLIISADVFTYIGELEELFFALFSSLKKNGRILFTISENSLNNKDWFLHVSGRFLHQKNYVEKTLTKAGFKVEKINREKLRNEGELQVMGYVVSAYKDKE